MASKSNIEWTGGTWNPTYGCDKVSAGCKNCYAMRDVYRIGCAHPDKYGGLVEMRTSGPEWTGKLKMAPDKVDLPLRWKDPRKIFVNSLSDLFHNKIPFDFIDDCFVTMLLAERHTFQVLTKRPENMSEYFEHARERITEKLIDKIDKTGWAKFSSSKDGKRSRKWVEEWVAEGAWPLPNVWLGVSVEDQDSAYRRIPFLHTIPAAVKWLSMEPLLAETRLNIGMDDATTRDLIDWVVVGGESGPKARPLKSEWVDIIHEDCERIGIPFHFKQWGRFDNNPDQKDPTAKNNGGKAKGGRTYQGKLWDEEPAKAA